MQKSSDLIHNASPPPYRLPARDALYGSSDVAYILKHAFPGVFPQFCNKDGVTQASYYETEYAVIFPPCSDTADSQYSQLESIETILKQNRPHLESRLEELKNKQWLFPIVEEQNLFGRPRNHWVTLCYKPETGEITLIDSTGAGGDLGQIADRLNISGRWIRTLASRIEQATKSYVYPTSSMQNMLIDGLAPYSLKPKPIKIVYKEVQIDNIHCGRWTAIILMSLAFGKEPTLSMDDLPNILAYFEKFDQTKFVPYETFEERNNNLTKVSAEKSDYPNITSSDELPLNESPVEITTHGVEQVSNSTTTMVTGREPPTYFNHDHSKRGFGGQYSYVSSTSFSISLSSASLYKAFSRRSQSFIASYKPGLTSVSSFSNFLRPTTPVYIPRQIPTNRLSVAAPHSNGKVDGSTTTIVAKTKSLMRSSSTDKDDKPSTSEQNDPLSAPVVLHKASLLQASPSSLPSAIFPFFRRILFSSYPQLGFLQQNNHTLPISRYILSAQRILGSGAKLLNINSETYPVKKSKRIKDGITFNKGKLKLADVHSHEHDHKPTDEKNHRHEHESTGEHGHRHEHEYTDERDHEHNHQHAKDDKPSASENDDQLVVLREASPLPVSSRSLLSAIPQLFRSILFSPTSQLGPLQQKNYIFTISRYMLSTQHILSSGAKLLNINSETSLRKKPNRIKDNVAFNQSELMLADERSHEHDHEHTDGHNHEHNHEHTDEHSHEHDHEHTDEHNHEHNHEHTDEHSHEHDHEHTDEHNHEHDHEHTDEHNHEHDHEHTDERNHEHDHEHTDERNHEHDHEQRQNISGSNVTTSTHTSSATSPQTDSAHHSTKYAINPSFKRVPSSTNVNQHPFFTPPNSELLKPINKPSHSHSYFSNHFRLRCLQALFITSAITFTVLAVLLSPSVAIIGAGLTAGLIAALCYSALGTAFMIGVSAAGLEVSDVYEQHMQRSQENFGTKPLAPF